MQESLSIDAAAAKLIDPPSFTVFVAKFINHEIENNSLNKAEIKKRFVKLA